MLEEIVFVEFNFFACVKSDFLDLNKFRFLDLANFIIIDRLLIFLPILPLLVSPTPFIIF